MTMSTKFTSAFGALAACAALLLAAPSALADQTGDAVTCAQVGGGNFGCSPGTGTAAPVAGAPVPSTVGAGPEFTIEPSASNGYISVDFTGTGMTLLFTQDADLQNTQLDFTDVTAAFTSYVFLSQTGMAGLTVGPTTYPAFSASDVSLVNGVLHIDLRDTSNKAGDGFSLSLSNSANATPEPSSLALLGTGTVAMLEVIRRRRRA